MLHFPSGAAWTRAGDAIYRMARWMRQLPGRLPRAPSTVSRGPEQPHHLGAFGALVDAGDFDARQR